jgi:hypothetical protein
MNIDGGVSMSPGDNGAGSVYLPTAGVTSLVDYPQSAPPSVALTSNTPGSHTHRSRGYTAARHHATHAAHHQHKTRSHVRTRKAVADVGLEYQTF